MAGTLCHAALFGALTAASISAAAVPQGTSARAGTMRSVPEPYVGNWVCQSIRPGYNLVLPSSDPSQPQTNRATTASTVVVQKFSLRADGTYQTANAAGHYSFDPATHTILWLDGPQKDTFTQTQLGKRDDGESKISLTLNRRYYGCFKPKSRP
jgi:hypothetical protein